MKILDLFIKNCFTKYSLGCLNFGLLVLRKYTLTLLWDENFVFWKGRIDGYFYTPHKKSSFHTDFKNVHLTHLTFVKSAPKKVLPKKKIFLDLATLFYRQDNFVAKTFLVHFSQRSKLHFWNQYEKTEGQKCKKPHSIFRKTVFINSYRS